MAQSSSNVVTSARRRHGRCRIYTIGAAHFVHVHHYGVVVHCNLDICILRRLYLCRLRCSVIFLYVWRKNVVILFTSVYIRFNFFSVLNHMKSLPFLAMLQVVACVLV